MKITWNRKGFQQIRTAPGVAAELLDRGWRIADACGPGFEATPSENSVTRDRVYVQPVNAKAARKNASENTILTNIDAGRG